MGGGDTIHPAMGVRQSMFCFVVFVKECRNVSVERVGQQGRLHFLKREGAVSVKFYISMWLNRTRPVIK